MRAKFAAANWRTKPKRPINKIEGKNENKYKLGRKCCVKQTATAYLCDSDEIDPLSIFEEMLESLGKRVTVGDTKKRTLY